jgi:hypothetical protein
LRNIAAAFPSMTAQVTAQVAVLPRTTRAARNHAAPSASSLEDISGKLSQLTAEGQVVRTHNPQQTYQPSAKILADETRRGSASNDDPSRNLTMNGRNEVLETSFRDCDRSEIRPFYSLGFRIKNP